MEKMGVKEIMARGIAGASVPLKQAYQRDSYVHERWSMYQGSAQAAIAALENAGFQIVPVEPTEAMMDAAIEAMMKPRMHVGSYKHDKGPDAWAAYEAMLKSAQT